MAREIESAGTKVIGGYFSLEQRIDGYDYEIHSDLGAGNHIGSVSFEPGTIDYIEGINNVDRLLDVVGPLSIPEILRVLSIDEAETE